MRRLIAVAAFASLLSAGGAGAQTYDLAGDFGSSVFQYGGGTAGTSFTAFSQVQGPFSTCASGFTCYIGGGGYPFISKNNNPTAVSSNGVTVPAGGLPFFLAPLGPVPGGSISFSFSTTLAAGQTIGFAVNNNAGEYSYDSTGLSGTIRNTTVAVPGPIAGAGIPALLALGGVIWARRRQAA